MTPKEKHRWLVRETSKYLKYYNGCFVECGVKQGTSSRIMAEVLQRTGYLFDTWTGFPHYSKYDLPNSRRKRRLDSRVRNKKSFYKDCKRSLKKFGVLKYCTMIKGDICETVPEFVKDNSLVVDMLHIDTDLHDPASISLELFSPFLSENGIILMHDYGDCKWPGIKKVVDSFVNNNACFFIDHNSTIGVKVASLSKSDLELYSKYINRKWKRCK